MECSSQSSTNDISPSTQHIQGWLVVLSERAGLDCRWLRRSGLCKDIPDLMMKLYSDIQFRLITNFSVVRSASQKCDSNLS